jgi:exonuclease III
MSGVSTPRKNGMPSEVKFEESASQIVCLQETKRELFDHFYIKKFCPRHLDHFAFAPSIGASSGLITLWNNNLFDGSVVHCNSYAITIKLHCRQDNKTFHVTNVYGPSNPLQKLRFITWLMNLDTSDFVDWLLAGDFNLIRFPKNRNKPGGELTEMNMFNKLISDLDLAEIPFCGRSFTWSNMQSDPLMVKLD